jgi:hypothetical protein
LIEEGRREKALEGNEAKEMREDSLEIFHQQMRSAKFSLVCVFEMVVLKIGCRNRKCTKREYVKN